MKQRLPRKAKKIAKKQVSAMIAFRTLQGSLIAAMAMAQTSIVSAEPRPIEILTSAHVALKALKIAEITSQTANQIGKILSEKPNHWKDFLR